MFKPENASLQSILTFKKLGRWLFLPLKQSFPGRDSLMLEFYEGEEKRNIKLGDVVFPTKIWETLIDFRKSYDSSGLKMSFSMKQKQPILSFSSDNQITNVNIRLKDQVVIKGLYQKSEKGNPTFSLIPGCK